MVNAFFIFLIVKVFFFSFGRGPIVIIVKDLTALISRIVTFIVEVIVKSSSLERNQALSGYGLGLGAVYQAGAL